MVTGLLWSVYTMKQTRSSKLRAHVVHVYFQYICFMFAFCLLHRVNTLLGLLCSHYRTVSSVIPPRCFCVYVYFSCATILYGE